MWDKTKLATCSKKSHNQNLVCMWDKIKLIYYLLNIKLYFQTAVILSFINCEREVAKYEFCRQRII